MGIYIIIASIMLYIYIRTKADWGGIGEVMKKPKQHIIKDARAFSKLLPGQAFKYKGKLYVRTQYTQGGIINMAVISMHDDMKVLPSVDSHWWEDDIVRVKLFFNVNEERGTERVILREKV